MSTTRYVWQDLESLTLWLRRLLYLAVALSVVSLIENIRLYGLFRRLVAQGIPASNLTDSLVHASIWANSILQACLGCFGLAVSILACVWIYRAAGNLHTRQRSAMITSPGWAVGSYFVPFVNLWSPYEAMKEIWRGSFNLHERPYPASLSLLRWWWFLWLARNLSHTAVVTIFASAQLHAATAGALLFAYDLSTATVVSNIALNLVFAALTARIWRMQAGHAPPKPPALPALDAAS